MKRIIGFLLAVLLMSACVTTAFADSSPTFSYVLLLTDSSGKEIRNPAALKKGEKVNVSIDMTRTDSAVSEYQVYGVEFKVRTDGLIFNEDGEAFREGTDVVAIQYFNGLVTGVTYLDLALQGETVADPLRVASWSYTVDDPANVWLDVTTALVYVTGEENSSVPLQRVSLTLDPASGDIRGDISGEYEEGTVVTLPTATRSGYTFSGWSDGRTVYPAGTKLTLDNSVYLTAQWEIVEMPFTDVPKDAYYHDAVVWAIENGITDGTSDTTFSPNANCTRAQVVTFLWRAFGCPAPTNNANPFHDVAADSYYYDAVLWAVEKGITDGVSADTFASGSICTRAQIVTFMLRAAGGSAPSDTGTHFKDVASDTYYYDAVAWAVENGITDGTGDTTFTPDGNCTRAQIVTFLWRYMAE